ncbi:MAG: hypothetical protein WD535_03790 [Thermaerobacterales bacterium]
MLDDESQLDEDLAVQLETDYRTADLAADDLVMLDFASKLTLTPAAIGPSDIDRLHEHGFEDADILEIIAMTSYFNFTNRMNGAIGTGY